MKENNSTSRVSGGKLVSTGTTNLYRNNVTGVYYARKKFGVNGLVRDLNRSLDTDVKTTALERLAAKLAEMAKEVNRAPSSLDNSTTFGACVDMFMAEKTEQNRIKKFDDNSLKILGWSRKKMVKVWGEKFMERPIKKLALADFKQKHNDLHVECSSTYVNLIRQIITGAFDFAVRGGIVEENLGLELSNKSTHDRKEKSIPQGDEQLAALLGHIRASKCGHKNKVCDLIEFFCWFGSRKTETNLLRKDDVNVGSNYMGEIPPMTIRFRDETTKNAKNKFIPIFPGALPLVNKLLADKRSGDRLVLGKECLGSLAKACKALGFEKWTHHTFRHVFATRALIVTNCDYFTVANWLGHQDGGKLLSVRYAHLNQAHSQAQAKKLNYNFNPSAPVAAEAKDTVELNGQVWNRADLAKLLEQLGGGKPVNVIDLPVARRAA